MSYRKNWIVITVVILGLAMFIPVAQAQRQDVEFIICGTSTSNVVHSTPELGITSFDGKYIVQSTHENKLFDNWTGHSVGIFKRLDSKAS